jgi:xanthine dehydrogenase FAD-binding subunit
MKVWYRPVSLSAAVEFLAQQAGHTRIIQGGTDVMVGRGRGLDDDAHWLDLGGIAELRELHVAAEGRLSIGAGVPLARLGTDSNVVQYWPNLAVSASQTGAPAIQNRATIGGNICNASPAADNAPALLAYNAELEIVGPSGYRRLPYRDFHLSYRRTALEPNELLVRIFLPRAPAGAYHYYRKVGTRAAQSVAKVGLAAVLRWNPSGSIVLAHFAFSSVASTPRLAEALGRSVCGKNLKHISLKKIQEQLKNDIAPVSDIRSSDGYRLEVAGRLVWQALYTSFTRITQE